MKIKPINIFFILLILGFLFACDHGINPEEAKENVTKSSGISGTIYYQNWPQDNLLDLRLVVFKNYPPADIVGEVTSGEAIAYPDISMGSLPFYTDSTNYQVVLEPRLYEYIVVAHQFGPAIFFDWQVVGQYDTTLQDTIPTSIQIFSDSIISGINIYVDFDSLPGQPF
jgi:hypothetical protein